MFKKAIAAAGVSAAILCSAGVASGGEWNPSRGYIHTEGGVTVENPGASICSYSGRDDPDPGDDGLLALSPAKGRVQSPGQYVAVLGTELAGVPGHECRGNSGH